MGVWIAWAGVAVAIAIVVNAFRVAHGVPHPDLGARGAVDPHLRDGVHLKDGEDHGAHEGHLLECHQDGQEAHGGHRLDSHREGRGHQGGHRRESHLPGGVEDTPLPQAQVPVRANF